MRILYIYVCMDVCTYVYVYIRCVYALLHVCMYVCTYVFMYIYYIWKYAYMHIYVRNVTTFVFISVSVSCQ